jgi:hypothetical protein
VGVAVIILQLSLSASFLSFGEVRYFPGSYYDAHSHSRLHRRVMERWPGPAALLELWRTGELDEKQRVALLLGGAAYHDPALLPLYYEAISSESPRLRQAAAYGYRDLLADRLPNVRMGVDDNAVRQLRREMRAMRWTLRRQPLVAMWLQAALTTEDIDLPGYRGASLPRGATECFRSVDRLMKPEDLELLIRAYRSSKKLSNRIALMRLIEGLTLSVFVEKPQGERKGWGPEIHETGLERLDGWLAEWVDGRCRISYNRMVSENMARLGAKRADPLHPETCHIWEAILRGPNTAWWSLSARRLYECGGPWRELSVLQAESDTNRENRDQLLRWYGDDYRKTRDTTGKPEPP